ncbi:auxin-responsive protein SAUR32-like [Elaeis guineensis]|uniref:Auxin-responsive protein SAUR32 n=1 Tax=Elaeis guineensis var. tenera TaxID=51953 RepID=A0A6I9QFQ6_ELAGV|nr:auxin-responsive protein SAUR32 [Elaeis guineensis]
MRREEKYHQQHQNHHRLLSFHPHAPHLGHKHRHEKGKSPATTMPPKGWVGIRVGQEGEEQHRFEVPVEYLKHPLFVGLLHQAEEEFGFEQNGAITIPCGVDHFRHVQDIIDRDSAAAHHHGHHPHLAGCFGA